MKNYSFLNQKIVRPFKTGWLEKFAFSPDNILFTDKQLIDIDNKITVYSGLMPIDMKNRLMARSETLGSAAIAKAEKTNQIRAEEMRQIKAMLDSEPDMDYLLADMTIKKEIKKEHDRLEYFNALKTFRWASIHGNITAQNLSIGILCDIHERMTDNLDFFKDKLPDFTPYRQGTLRCNNDMVAFGDWMPADNLLITDSMDELMDFYMAEPNITNLNLFISALYSVHPFDNGNKRVCRILEHGLLRDLGINQPKLYSHLYYYYENIDRFYSRIEQSMRSYNLTHAVNLSREAIFFSQMSVMMLAAENKRHEFISQREMNESRMRFYGIFTKHKSIQHKNINKHTKTLPDRTLNEFLKQGVSHGILLRSERGKAVYYGLNIETEEEQFIKDHIAANRNKISFMPQRLEKSVYAPAESWRERLSTNSSGTNKAPSHIAPPGL